MTRSRDVFFWIVPPVAVGVILWIALASPDRAFSVPVNQGTSALEHLAQVKTVLHEGRQSPRLPWLAPLDFAIVRAIGLTGAGVGGTANLAWLLMLMLAAPIAAWGYRRLGLSLVGAGVMGGLYALSPYALFWNLEMPNAMPFLVPFAATAALALATGAVRDWPKRDVTVLLAGTVLLGLNGREYAYFGAFLVAIGAVAGAIRLRSTGAGTRGAVVTAVMVAAIVVSLMPGLRAPQRDPDPNFRVTAGDTESGGVKIRQLLGPLPFHWLPAFVTWSRHEGTAGFPYESANHLSRLGIVAGIGFLGLLAVLLVPSAAGPPPHGETVHAASGLALAGFLVATVGGLGGVISLLIEPEILTFSRITPFLIFFSLAAIGVWVDRVAAGRRRGLLVWAAVAVFALTDQMVAVRPLHKGVAKARVEYRQLHGFVQRLEARLPEGARVFFLPHSTDPFVRRGVRMAPNDFLKPDLVSSHLRWRYPTRTDAEARDDKVHTALEVEALPARLGDEGYSAIVVDRLGFEDSGQAVREALVATGRTTLVAESDRYLALLIRR